MNSRTATMPIGLGDVASRIPTLAPAFFDFSVPVAHAERWTLTNDDVIEANVAGLISKERRLSNILRLAMSACAHSNAVYPNGLMESARTFAGHCATLKALYPGYVSPSTHRADRVRLAIVSACCAVAAKLVSARTSYPAKLHELYAAASEISISYVALQATALALGDRCAAAVAARHLRHVGQLLLTLHELVPHESVRELQSRGLSASTADLWEVAGVSALPS